MDPAISSALAAVLGTLAGGSISFLLNRQQFNHQLKVLHEQNKVEYMAEETARHFLTHKSFADRSFETLKKISAASPTMSCAKYWSEPGQSGPFATMVNGGGCCRAWTSSLKRKICSIHDDIQ